MTDRLRTDRQADAGEPQEREREARVEELLLAGLDHYFATHYAEAINIWTRVLFLDRSHARARAYIERARGAIAERQREADELLQHGVSAFQEGNPELARRLLTRALERGGAQQEEALAMLGRLDRLQAAAVADPLPTATPRRGAHPAPPIVPPGRDRWLLWFSVVVLLSALATIAMVVVTRSGRAPSWISLLPIEVSHETRTTPPEALPTLQAGEVALVRARALYARGRLHDALRALQPVTRGDHQATDADALRAEIQRTLLAAAGARPPVARPTAGDSR
jgi:tetratricopeptide (TPR) repeat protein